MFVTLQRHGRKRRRSGAGRRDDAREDTEGRDTADVVYAEEDDGKYSDDDALQRRGWEREWRYGREEGDG